MSVRQASLDSINRDVDYISSLHDAWPDKATDEQMAFVFATLVPHVVCYFSPFLFFTTLMSCDLSLELSRQGVPGRP